jgi:hypothetical protein
VRTFTLTPVIAAKAGTQVFWRRRATSWGPGGAMNSVTKKAWVPAFAGMIGLAIEDRT